MCKAGSHAYKTQRLVLPKHQETPGTVDLSSQIRAITKYKSARAEPFSCCVWLCKTYKDETVNTDSSAQFFRGKLRRWSTIFNGAWTDAMESNLEPEQALAESASGAFMPAADYFGCCNSVRQADYELSACN